MTRAALVLSCEHASRALPARWRPCFGGAAEAAALLDHRGSDLGARALARRLAGELGAPLYEGRWSRLLVDLNRSPGHAALHGRALRRRPAVVRAAIVEEYWRPWRTALRLEMERAIARHGEVLHVSIHSFTPVWRGRPRGVDLGVLDDPRRPRERALAERLLRELRARLPELRVRRNLPYRGWTDGCVPALRRALPLRRYCGVELEVSQALATDGRARQRLARAIGAAVRAAARA